MAKKYLVYLHTGNDIDSDEIEIWHVFGTIKAENLEEAAKLAREKYKSECLVYNFRVLEIGNEHGKVGELTND